MKKKLTSLLVVALIAVFLLPNTSLNNNVKNNKQVNKVFTCLSVDPPGLN